MRDFCHEAPSFLRVLTRCLPISGHALVKQKKILKQVFILQNSFNSYLLLFFTCFFVELFCFLLNESNRLSHSNVASVVFKIFTKIQLVARWFGVALRRQLFHCVWWLILRRLEQIDGDVDFLHQLEILYEIETIQIFVRGNRFGKTNVTTRKNNSVIQSPS